MLFSKMRSVNEKINQDYITNNIGENIALVGNPNVGKSTIFNVLTGMRQHTGNWPGKTVKVAKGEYYSNGKINTVIDLPGAYSLVSHSSEEEVTRDFIFSHPEWIFVIICDASCLQRNLNLVLQILGFAQNVVVVLNLIDEAHKKNILIDTKMLKSYLKTNVLAMSAHNDQDFTLLKKAISNCKEPIYRDFNHIYPELIVESIKEINAKTNVKSNDILQCILHGDNLESYIKSNHDFENDPSVCEYVKKLIDKNGYENIIIQYLTSLQNYTIEICCKSISNNNADKRRENKFDTLLLKPILAYLWMGLLLGIIFWITIEGANIPSMWLQKIFNNLELWSSNGMLEMGVNDNIVRFINSGILRTLGWVVSVMLPPMAIFFPLFALLEDFGILPRIAFALDGYFNRAKTCGKQALTMMMGFGCNAAAIIGTRIIDNPRERTIAMITNVFVPCNGRFPTIIALITIFFTGINGGIKSSILGSAMLVILILFGVFVTFKTSKFLSRTFFKGEAMPFALELPPYRRPQFAKVIIRSFVDKSMSVLGRAICSAVPAGAIIFLLANITVDDISLLMQISQLFDPLAKLMGLDGVILFAFILGFPANEIVLPIMIMAYSSLGSMVNYENLFMVKSLLVANGWTWITALCFMVFSLLHFPCATTCISVYKESKSIKTTVIAFVLPTTIGILVCILVNLLCQILN